MTTMIEAKSANIHLNILPVSKLPNLLVNISWHCSNADQYALKKLKSVGAQDPQFESGAECMALCYSLFQRIKERKELPYTSRYQVNCLNCSVQNDRFQICFTTISKLSALKKTLVGVIEDLNIKKVHKQYVANIKNIGGKYNKYKENYIIAEQTKSLHKEIYITVCGKIKLNSVRAGKQVTELQNVRDLAALLHKKFPKWEPAADAKKEKVGVAKFVVPPEKMHTEIKIKTSKYIKVMPNILCDYFEKTLQLRCMPKNDSIVIWQKNIDAKLNQTKQEKKYEREMLNKTYTMELVAAGLLSGCADNVAVVEFVKTKPQVAEFVKEVIKSY